MSTDEYVPSDDDVRIEYVLAHQGLEAQLDAGEAYDRWLAAHDARVRRDAEAELDSWMTRAYEAEKRAWQAEKRIAEEHHLRMKATAAATEAEARIKRLENRAASETARANAWREKHRVMARKRDVAHRAWFEEWCARRALEGGEQDDPS